MKCRNSQCWPSRPKIAPVGRVGRRTATLLRSRPSLLAAERPTHGGPQAPRGVGGFQNFPNRRTTELNCSRGAASGTLADVPGRLVANVPPSSDPLALEAVAGFTSADDVVGVACVVVASSSRSDHASVEARDPGRFVDASEGNLAPRFAAVWTRSRCPGRAQKHVVGYVTRRHSSRFAAFSPTIAASSLAECRFAGVETLAHGTRRHIRPAPTKASPRLSRRGRDRAESPHGARVRHTSATDLAGGTCAACRGEVAARQLVTWAPKNSLAAPIARSSARSAVPASALLGPFFWIASIAALVACASGRRTSTSGTPVGAFNRSVASFSAVVAAVTGPVVPHARGSRGRSPQREGSAARQSNHSSRQRITLASYRSTHPSQENP